MNRKITVAAAVAAAGLSFVAAGVAEAKPSPLSLKASAGSCNGQGVGNSTLAQAQWTNKVAESGKFSVTLEKSAPTTDCSFAAVVVKGVEGRAVGDLGAIGFSADTCGGGAPRFNLLYDTDGDGAADGVGFYGCANHVTGTNGAWTHMSADPTVADNGAVPADATVVQLYVIVDEQGTYHVDNVSVGDVVVGEPNGGS